MPERHVRVAERTEMVWELRNRGVCRMSRYWVQARIPFPPGRWLCGAARGSFARKVTSGLDPSHTDGEWHPSARAAPTA